MADLAAEQHRVVEAKQLHRLGLTRGAIERRVARGRLHVIHRGVYAVGSRNIGRDGFLIAAVFACGEGALLSHETAADHRSLTRSSSRAIHVTVPGRNKPNVRGVTVHLTRRLTDADRAVHRGVPVTSVPRTLIDLAAVVRRAELIRALEQAQRLRLFDMRAIEELLRRSNGRRGARALRAALKELFEEPPDTRSPLEERFRAFCQNRGISLPAFNVTIAGYCVDAAWLRHKVVVELDSKRHHLGIDAFEGDRKRDTKLQIAGFRIARVTERRLTGEPAELEADIRSLLQ
ncbi:MAG TPA: type IV toxin-antitoxin system AbiEi family antitoxin domain-containing protein [Thermoleophilaceae bacterium]